MVHVFEFWLWKLETIAFGGKTRNKTGNARK